MTNKFIVNDITQVTERRLIPSVTTWNRLEARPRTANFDRALKAEVRDALSRPQLDTDLESMLEDGVDVVGKARLARLVLARDARFVTLDLS